MTLNYREHPPPPQLIDDVECSWISYHPLGVETCTRVLPDGCADILYSRSSNGTSLTFVGPMSRYQDFQQAPGTCQVGVRFRPAMWPEVIRTNGNDVLNTIAPLQAFWDRRAAELLRLLDDASEPLEIARAIQNAVLRVSSKSPFQQAIRAIERSRGTVALDDVASLAGLSSRQFRRRCREATSFSPKLLARILRFRHAVQLAPTLVGHHAELAAQCGYADQSHLIADFQAFAGQTPHALAENSR